MSSFTVIVDNRISFISNFTFVIESGVVTSKIRMSIHKPVMKKHDWTEFLNAISQNKPATIINCPAGEICIHTNDGMTFFSDGIIDIKLPNDMCLSAFNQVLTELEKDVK